ncbi:glycosyltransferase family 1 protein [Hahella sp. KA22]|nr:glycosyltransferase family 1 protein [Hahella sp. KA22]
MILLNRDIEWYLYTNRPLVVDFGDSNIKIRSLSKNWGFSGTLVAQVMFPFWAKRDELDVFWSPRHHLPLMLYLSRLRKVVTIHDMVWKKCPESMSAQGFLAERIFMPPTLRMADRVIAVSKSTQKDLIEYDRKLASKVDVVYEAPFIGVSENEDIRQEYSVDKYFLFVGTIEPRKNLKRLLEAYARLLDEGIKSHRLIIVGGKGWGRVALEEFIVEKHLKDWVELKGRVEDSELRALYKGASALLMPSLYEGFGLPIAEAISLSVPVITSKRSSMPEVAGECALYVDPESVDSILEAIKVLAKDNEVLGALKANTVKQAKRFSWESAAVDTLGILKPNELSFR